MKYLISGIKDFFGISLMGGGIFFSPLINLYDLPTQRIFILYCHGYESKFFRFALHFTIQITIINRTEQNRSYKYPRWSPDRRSPEQRVDISLGLG